MHRGLQWTFGVGLAAVALAVVGWMVSAGEGAEQTKSSSAEVRDVEVRRTVSAATIYDWRSPFGDVLREVDKGAELQVDIASVRDGWVAVYDEGERFGYAPVDVFGARVGWTPPELTDTSAAPIEPASLLQVDHIKDDLAEDYTLADVYVTTSSQYEWTYYVAARVHGPAVDAGGEIGFWLTKGALNKVYMVVTVDDVAARVSEAQSAKEAGAEASPSDPEARRLAEYLTRTSAGSLICGP